MAHDSLPAGYQLQHRHIPAKRMVNNPLAMAVCDCVKQLLQVKHCKKSVTYLKRWIFDFLDRASPIQAIALKEWRCAGSLAHLGSTQSWQEREGTYSQGENKNGKGLLHLVQVARKIKTYVENVVQYYL
jgi:hypothetical protein